MSILAAAEAALTDDRHASTGTDAAGSVMISFYTTTYAHHMPEQTYAVPLNVLPDGLSSLVRSVLQVDDHQNFDFLYKNEYIGTTLSRFLMRRGVSFEELLHVEYTPALQAKEGHLLPHDDWVSSVRAPYRGNGELLLTGSYDHCVRLWDGENCLALGTFHRECVKEVCLHPIIPQRLAATSSSPSTRKRVRSSAPNDFLCASCSKDGSVAAWRFDSTTSEMSLLGSINAHTDGVDSIHISPVDGQLIATAGWDSTVKIFSWSQIIDGGDALPSTKSPIVTFSDHARPVLACRFSEANDGKSLYSAGLDGVVKNLDVSLCELQSQYSCDHPINAITVKPNNAGSGDLIIAGCTDNRARLFDSRQKEVVRTFSGHRQWIYSATWLWDRVDGDASHTNGSLFATCSEDSTVRVYDLRCTNTALLTMDALHTDGVLDVSYAGQSIIASCGKDNKTKSFSVMKES